MYNRKSIKYFFFTTCVIAILYPLINIYFIFPSFSRLLVNNTENEAVRVARNLSSIVISDNNELKKPGDFSKAIEKVKDEFHLEKIKVFTAGGEIIHSTEPEDIGKINNKDYFREIVAKGNSFTKVVQKDTRTLEDRVVTVDVVETYVPIMNGNTFLGAFEIYFDITETNQELNSTVFHSSSITFALMFGFFILIVFLISRSEKEVGGSDIGTLPASYQSAFYLLLVMMVSIFIAEIIVMSFVSNFPPMSKTRESVIDSLLLVMIVSPVLYHFLFRPLIIHIEKRKRAEEGLRKAQDILVELNEDLKKEIEVRRKAEKLIMKSQQEWEDTFNFITDMITIHDRDFNIIKANRVAGELLGLPVFQNSGAKCYRFYHGADGPPEGCPSCDCLNTGVPAVFEVFEPHLNKHIEIRAIPRFDGDNRINGLIHIVRDITERKKMEDRLKTMSLTDELTGLYNRRGFFAMFERQVKIIRRQKERTFLLYADLDNFKEINDTFGHQEGDAALIVAADILKSTYRESDIIARIGGDEFVVFPVGNDETNVNLIVARLQKNINAFNAKTDRGYTLSMSVGVAPYDPEYFHTIDGLLAEADKLMYTQKRQKRNV